MKTLMIAALTTALVGPLTEDQVEGAWCVTTARSDGIVVAHRETWVFEPDDTVVIETEEPTRYEAVYDLRGDRIETSTMLPMTVLEITEDRMIAIRQQDTRLTFVRGTCD